MFKNNRQSHRNVEMNMMNSSMFGKKCSNYHLNDTVVVIRMVTAAVINEIICPLQTRHLIEK